MADSFVGGNFYYMFLFLLSFQNILFLFAPTQSSKDNLRKEGIKNKTYVVGNTVVDALFLALSLIKKDGKLKSAIEGYFKKLLPELLTKSPNIKVILVTAHRRESFGKPFGRICKIIKKIAIRNDNVHLIYPVHLNPNVRNPVFKLLKGIRNIHLIEPIPYPYFVWLMNKSYIVLTDSGGIQEEAPSLGKPVLVMRGNTERLEAVKSRIAQLVGTEVDKVINEVEQLLRNKSKYEKIANIQNPFGDGRAAKRIVKIILDKVYA